MSEADKILEALDSICVTAGQQKITDLIKSFNAKIPKEMHDIVIAQVKDDVAKAIKEGIEKSTSEMSKVIDNPEIIEKLKKATREEEEATQTS